MIALSVVIPTHNRPAGLRRALRSVFDQSVLPDEIIVVDDGSEPPVDEAMLLGCPEGTLLSVLRNDAPRGAQVARNRGVEASTSDYVAFLDDDDEFDPGKIGALKGVLNSESDVIYHPALMTYDNERVVYVSNPSERITFSEMLVSNQIGGTSMVCVRRAAFLNIGAFDERMPALQDYEAWLRCAKNNLKFLRIDYPYTIYHHVTTSGSISKSLDKLEMAVEIIEQKYGDDIQELDADALRRREKRKVVQKSHRMLMRGDSWNASMVNFSGGIRLASINLIAGGIISLSGLRITLLLKKFVERKRRK